MKGALGGLMKQAQQMQDNMKKAQEELAQMSVHGESGGGMVKIEINGRHDALNVNIDPALMDDREMLEDLISAAINDATQKLERVSKEKMSGMMGGIDLPPGFKMPF